MSRRGKLYTKQMEDYIPDISVHMGKAKRDRMGMYA